MLPAAACPRQLLGSFSGGQQLNLIKQLHQAQDDVALLALASYVTSANRLAGLQDESLFSKHVDLLHKVHTRRGTRFQLLANSEDRRYRRALQDRRFAWTIGTQQNVATLRRLVSDVRPELLGEGDTDWAAVLQAAEQGNEDAVHVGTREARGSHVSVPVCVVCVRRCNTTRMACAWRCAWMAWCCLPAPWHPDACCMVQRPARAFAALALSLNPALHRAPPRFNWSNTARLV